MKQLKLLHPPKIHRNRHGHHYLRHQVRIHRKNQQLRYHHTIQVKNQNQTTHHFEQYHRRPLSIPTQQLHQVTQINPQINRHLYQTFSKKMIFIRIHFVKSRKRYVLFIGGFIICERKQTICTNQSTCSTISETATK